MKKSITANKGKQLSTTVEGIEYVRLPIKTKVVTSKDDIVKLCIRKTKRHLKKGDILFISEKIVAISQGRAYPIAKIEVSKLAHFLQSHVTKTPAGIGLGSPWTMQLALNEVGITRILIAAGVAAITKPLGIRGLFYHIAGRKAAAIDGPCAYTLPPFNKYAKLAPINPSKVAREIKASLGDHDVVIIDANDLGVEILGVSHRKVDKKLCKAVFKDNPLGQESQQTPLCILRAITV
ncbi:F420-0--gamma-glutamyl ligase [Candidatus Uhrbacteria bacterium CG_4_10_14_0_2_um_filter_41_7]|uniref:F420-0--gamma-glutamyl ligase n=1 Tax=Candidatus Uhrbacteria bacterium CG_4_9_14_3_um_filter_41_35 TaxID=1975034 RepID=A0A2M7XGG1_9BACT|nr:MAG: F420-0--gamma-glutamyl ligase [Candidatus Uhrbacteria bacterium CG11_big_fil_rev_8_21_14_0_20_41_9]PIZ54178.1 MAG: F420-0--gamma-glutamyl ligase [Candidatus Uhrbacteria bacterium CG_4_10_14_0_2_um_filter_41_7]PJA46980.1 MAG: F420-0--gamma-glutamyl ligase [Candidatus Uhrbacteria bacterium CG_4_9_14_3_um_filter_41_35]